MAISAEFTADFSQFTAATAEAQGALEGLKGTSETIDLERQSVAAGRAIVDLGGKVQAFATDYINAFAEEEKATARLTSALQATGNATPAVIAQYQAMATQFQNTTKYSDDAVIAAQTVLTQIGHLGPEQMQPAIQAATDLAAGLGIGLEAAARKLATVIGSDGAKLGTLKTLLSDVDIKGKSAAEIIEIFGQKFSGAAAGDMTTYEGKMASLNNRFDDFKEKVGGAIATALTPLLDAFLALHPALQTLIGGAAALVLALTPVALAFGAVMGAVGPLIAAMGGWTAVWVGIAEVVGALIVPLGLLVTAIGAVYLAWRNWDAIAAIPQTIYNAVKTWLVDRFETLIGNIKNMLSSVVGAYQWMYDKVVGHSIVPDMITGIGREFGKLNDVMVTPADAAASGVLAAFHRMASNMTAIETDAGGIARNAFGQVVTPGLAMANLPKSWGVNITINGSVLSNKDEIARVVGDAVTSSYRTSGQRMPV